MLSSLALFLMMVIYSGGYPARVSQTLLFYTMGVTAIARMTIEEGRNYSTGYTVALGAASLFVMNRFFGGPISSAIVLFVIGYLADRIVHDCTIVEDNVDSSGQGLIDSGRSWFQKNTLRTADTDADTDLSNTKGSQPGRTVLYLAVGALPLFGIGQFFLRSQSSAWSSARTLLAIYLFASLSLLVVTAFLNLRRYLRQRNTEMPWPTTVAWLIGGMGMIAVILMLSLLAPLPGKTMASFKMPEFLKNTNPLKSSSYGYGNEGAEDSGENSPSSSDPSQDPPKPNAQSNSKKPGAAEGGQQSRPGAKPGGQSGNRKDAPPGKDPGGSKGQSKAKGEQEAKSQQSKPNKNSDQSKPADANKPAKPSDQSEQETTSKQKGRSNEQAQRNKEVQSSEKTQPNSQEPPKSETPKLADPESKAAQPNQSKTPSPSGTPKGDSKQQGKPALQGEQKQEGKPNKNSESDQKGEPTDNGESEPPSESNADESNREDPSSPNPDSDEVSADEPASQSNETETSTQENKTDQPDAKPTPPKPPDSSTDWSGLLSGVMGLLKFLMFVALLAIVAVYVYLNYNKILAWINEWLGGQETRSSDVAAPPRVSPKSASPPRPFSSFENPIGQAKPQQVVVITFQALEAWAREQGVQRSEDETPSEFARRVAIQFPVLKKSALSIVDAYNRIVYGQADANPKDVRAAKHVWEFMRPQL